MDKQQAQEIIKDTFESSFDKVRFTNFIKNLLNNIDESKAFHAHGYVKEGFRGIIKTYERIGTYNSADDKKVDIIVAYLQKGFSLDHARVTQRNFAGRYLVERGEKDFGLFAFVSPEESDWRFSLVKMDYKFEQTKSGRMKVKEEFTPARRWSFLVGGNEKSHTAQSRLVKILANDEQAPTLQELEKAFDIETVTKEFFLKYRELFLRTKEELDRVVKKDPKIKADFEAKGVDTVNFAKKLLGQIIFLYFLQKKGWFGVGRDDDWGTGTKHFLRELFEKKHADYSNFYNDILEPLFYEALRIDRSHDDGYYSRFDCKIPFLNGGLFDPIGNYDWVHTDILIPDKLFSNNVKTKEGDTGTGILDVFDRYNFTVKEDEPLEKEVAIDPELLGKSYEKFNAIRPDNFAEFKIALKSGKKGEENKFNKKFGVYYTPREIVYYMCQQSLINYLHTEVIASEAKQSLIPSKEDIETLIHTGEQVSENEAIFLEKEQKIKKGEQKTTSIKLILPDSIRKNAKLIDGKLAEITVCDPAVGSGAFPVGMMSEIVKARNVLTPFLSLRGAQATKQSQFNDNRTPYEFKRRCIEHSLYGVDIDPGAVEIAKLRLWLSLVVDEDDIENIKPLPNLDYKIVCGDSLLGYPYEPIGLEAIEKLKQQFFNEIHPKEKQRLHKEIDDAIYGLYKNTEQSLGYKVTIDFQINFSEVFRNQGGFHVVIANPPYVRQEAIRHLKPHLAKAYGNFYCGTADIYTYFYKRGIDLLKTSGHLCFIAPNKFMRAGYGKNTRVLLTTVVTPKLVIDFGALPIFDATTYPSILLVAKQRPDEHDKAAAATFTEADQLERLEETLNRIGFPIAVASLKKEGWNLERPEVLALMEKFRSSGIPLGEYVHGRFYRGVLTGFNEAFVIDAAGRKRLIAEDAASAELIKPWLRGRDICKWKAEWAGLYLINIPSSANRQWPWSYAKSESEAARLFEQIYPAVYRHLSQWEKQLHKRDDQGKFWWELRSCVYYEAFECPKIVYPNITKTNIFAFDATSILTNQKCFIIPVDDLYLLAVLNSKMATRWFRSTLPLLRGGYFEPSAIFMEKFPVFPSTDAQKAPIIELTRTILAEPDSPDVPRLEDEINNLIYSLYGLIDKETVIIMEKRG